MDLSADDLRQVLAENGIVTVLIGAHAASRYRLEARHTVDDVIIHKLIAGRPRDIDDIRSILSTHIALDESYVEDKAGQWEVLDRWIQLRSER